MSPDELALINGGKSFGLIYERKQKNVVYIRNERTNSTEMYEILLEFPFDSDWKRMSVICKDIQTDQIMMYMKGADSIMTPWLKIDNPLKVSMESDLYDFSCKGLWTLVMG